MFNAVLLRNLADNPNLVYNLVRAHKTFEDLGTFTLARGLREIRRKQLLKDERAARRDSTDKNAKSRDSQSDAERERPGDEKARLLRSESSIDVPDDIEAQRQSVSEEDRTGRPLMSPTLPGASISGEPPVGPSEKARGKMRARAESEDLTGSLERLAASGVGRNGFIPTQEWVSTNRSSIFGGGAECHFRR